MTLNPDGSVVVHTSIFEPGTGTYTILRQIVAEELQLPLSCIEVQVWDTDGVPRHRRRRQSGHTGGGSGSLPGRQ